MDNTDIARLARVMVYLRENATKLTRRYNAEVELILRPQPGLHGAFLARPAALKGDLIYNNSNIAEITMHPNGTVVIKPSETGPYKIVNTLMEQWNIDRPEAAE